jgi:hypothetical protein
LEPPPVSWPWRFWSWTCFLKNISCFRVLPRVKEKMNILHPIERRKANCIGHILRRNCLLKYDIKRNIEGRTEVTGKRGRRHKRLPYRKGRVLYVERGSTGSYTVCKTRFGRGYGPVVGQTTAWMNQWMNEDSKSKGLPETRHASVV